MHLTEPQLKTYLDGEMAEPVRAHAAAHLHTCPACQTTLHQLEARATRIGVHFASLEPTLTPSSSARAYHHLQQKLIQKEPAMFQKLFSPKFRPVLVTGIIVAFFAIMLTIPSFRAAAVNFLDLFRVQQIEVVEFNPANLPDSLENNFRNMDEILADDLKIEESGDPIEVADATEASKLAGFDVILPQNVTGETQLTVQPATTASFTIDLALWQALLEEMGRSDIELPKDLDGQTITFYADRSVTFAVGTCALPKEEHETTPYHERHCTVLIQTPSPRVDAPPTLPLDELGQAALRFLGMSAEDAASFSEKVDWTTTLIVPVPAGSNYQDVTVQGVPGTIFFDQYQGGSYHLMWVKDGIVYALSGLGDVTTALELANSLK
ncbi:MAG: hypothetical protein Fur0022_37050 [Anaerolineales bacterium]